METIPILEQVLRDKFKDGEGVRVTNQGSIYKGSDLRIVKREVFALCYELVLEVETPMGPLRVENFTLLKKDHREANEDYYNK